jgi:hypothetical protein
MRVVVSDMCIYISHRGNQFKLPIPNSGISHRHRHIHPEYASPRTRTSSSLHKRGLFAPCTRRHTAELTAAGNLSAGIRYIRCSLKPYSRALWAIQLLSDQILHPSSILSTS